MSLNSRPMGNKFRRCLLALCRLRSKRSVVSGRPLHRGLGEEHARLDLLPLWSAGCTHALPWNPARAHWARGFQHLALSLTSGSDNQLGAAQATNPPPSLLCMEATGKALTTCWPHEGLSPHPFTT